MASDTERMIVRNGAGGPNPFHKIYQCGNGWGASVIRGPYTYGGPEGLYELAIAHFEGEGPDWHISYDSEITDDVLGYLTLAEVNELLERIQELPPLKNCQICQKQNA